MTLTAKPLVGIGAVLSIGTLGGTPTFTAINGIKQFKSPSQKWSTEDVTTLDSTGGARVFVKTIQDPGGADISLMWESADAGQIALWNAFAASSNQANGAAYPFKLVLPINGAGGQTTTGDTFTFSALVTDVQNPEVQVDKAITWSVKLQVSGPITYVEGT